jgi:hypothetical protein
MPTREHYFQLAKQIRDDLGAKGFAYKSYPRREMTDRLRKISGEPTTRIKTANMGKEIEDVFRDQGLRFFPGLTDSNVETVRVWRAGTVAAEVLDLILHAGDHSDQSLSSIVQKMKGKWDWSSPFPPNGA